MTASSAVGRRPGAGQDGQAILRLGVEADAPPQIAENLRAYAAGPDSARWKIARAHEDDLRTMLLDGHVDAAVLWLPWQDPSIVMAAVTHITSFAVLPTDLAARYPGTVPGSFSAGSRSSSGSVQSSHSPTTTG
jgi:hypothetical protein